MEIDRYVNVAERGNKNLDTQPSTGSKLFKAVAVSFGLLCVLQVSLNISLRLTSYGDRRNRMNQSEEREKLQISLDKLSNEKDQLQIRYKDLSKVKLRLEKSCVQLASENAELQASHNIFENERNTLLKDIAELNSRIMACRSCDNRWTRLDSSCYYISTEQKTWEESRQDCIQRGAHLVIINSEREQTFLTELRLHAWIGLSDVSKGTWKWVDGSSLGKRYWRADEPNNYQGNPEDCVEMVAQDNPKILNWNDDQCHVKKKWVCEM